MTQQETWGIDEWLDFAKSKQPLSLEMFISDGSILADCRNNQDAMQLTSTFEDNGLDREYYLDVTVKGKQFTPKLRPNDLHNTAQKQNSHPR